jgi:hypothetical protein
LERIDELRRAEAPAGVLLGEVRSLLVEGERWLAAERREGSEHARAAFERLRNRVAEDGKEAVAG